ncbi:hypothetical protein [Corynebacterium amycolatum]
MTSFVGLGPMPGRNPHEAAEIVIGECLEGHVVVLDGLTPREVISGVIHDAMTA